jgi:type II secretory pathway pseudopilin PulG
MDPLLPTSHARNNQGFSLLEMIIAMGVLIVLTLGGTLGYQGIQKNSRTAATQAAAKSVYTEAIAYDIDNNAATAPTDAAEEYNAQGQDVGEDPSIKAEVYRMEDGAL